MRTRISVVVAFALVLVGCTGTHNATARRAGGTGTPRATTATVTATKTPCGWKSSTTYRHVVWIWMENRTYTSVLGNRAAAPHLASYAAKCGVATSYYAITHPSLPNYLAATSGSTGGVSSDCAPSACPQQRQSLFGQVQAARMQWRSYIESMPGNCSLSSSGRYAPKHNPAAYYVPVRSQCGRSDVPMGGTSGSFAGALAHRTLPAFSFVAPDLCDDGHDCSTSHADQWIGSWLGRITSSAAYRAGDTVVFLTWDEGVGSDQRIATVVLAPTVHKGQRVATKFTHYSLLRTTEEILRLHPLGAAATARSMRAAFRI